jgi:hypothetical protein
MDKNRDLVTLELSFHNLNKGTKWENDHYYFSVHGFSEIKDSERGEEDAREILSNSDYWDDIGMMDNKSFLTDYINFDEVAEHVLNTDGWENTNGEFYYFGHYGNKEYSLNLQWIGRDKKELFNKKEYFKIYVSDEDFKFLSKLGEIKPNSKELEEVNKILSKYQDKQRIIKDMLEEN